MQGQVVALRFQGGSDLNFTARPDCKNLGETSRNRSSSGAPGLRMRAILVANGDSLPLGVPRVECGAPTGAAGKNGQPDERKMRRWMRGLLDCPEFAARIDGTRAVSLMEGDFFEPFAVRRQLGNVDLLVRATRDRKPGEEPSELFGKVRGEPVRQRLEIPVERSSDRNARGQEARDAWVASRWCAVDLPLSARQEKPVALVHVGEEEKLGDGGEALEWFY